MKKTEYSNENEYIVEIHYDTLDEAKKVKEYNYSEEYDHVLDLGYFLRVKSFFNREHIDGFVIKKADCYLGSHSDDNSKPNDERVMQISDKINHLKAALLAENQIGDLNVIGSIVSEITDYKIAIL